MKNFGMLHVYTGTGKGKTSAALGLALRAIGHGARVIMSFVNFRNPDPIDVKMAQDAWEEGKRVLLNHETDVLILDEINLAMAKNLIDTKKVVSFLHNYRKNTEVVCTGREAPAELIDEADLVTDMQEVKHYFTLKNITIRDGIDH